MKQQPPDRSFEELEKILKDDMPFMRGDRPVPYKVPKNTEPCDYCVGSGTTNGRRCDKCYGTGVQEKS